MRYNKIRKMDISNGPGVRVSVFMQGCAFHCKNCFNPETWDFKQGKEFTDEIIDTVLELASKDFIVGLSILGGEPMHPNNIEGTTKLAKSFKEKYPNKTIWCWSGFLFDRDLKDKEVMKYIDVLVDGQYQDELHDFRLKWCGSSNQRVIDVQKSLKENKTVLFDDTKELVGV
jgi:anaerobic ribonucleoside-triphosphate reductase activating protein